jgi:hypothetical protein
MVLDAVIFKYYYIHFILPLSCAVSNEDERVCLSFPNVVPEAIIIEFMNLILKNFSSCE